MPDVPRADAEAAAPTDESGVNRFFSHPVLNSPYEFPAQHWELDAAGQPTQRVLPARRKAEFITPIPKPKKRKGGDQSDLVFDEGEGLSTAEQQYEHTAIITAIRKEVDEWRAVTNPSSWLVTPETERLLHHWRHHQFSDKRPFFCQVEAAETVIWLTEVAPKLGKSADPILRHLEAANHQANPELLRLALKLATGAGKTTVMAMLIAWQTVNAVRRPQSKSFTRGFLVVAPGITIKDRLRVLQPNDPDSYYASRELVPQDMVGALGQARIVITNYHAFKLRDRLELSKGGRALLQGRRGEDLQTLETEGQMLQRVMPELLGMKNILVLNDEAHHCYREKPGVSVEEELKGEEKKQAEENNEAARLWVSGLEAVNRTIGISRVVDLSATPFFLRGSGYAEGTLFPWTMTDFSLMDAIECGIVKLPRVPIADNIPGSDMPMYRNLWEHIRASMPKKGRGTAGTLDPLSLPTQLKTALDALYGHYAKTFEEWQKASIPAPPCFIVVCNNTATSKLVYEYISGFRREKEDGAEPFHAGALELFSNFDEHGNPVPRPHTLLIDSAQLESGEALDDNFRKMAAEEIDAFRKEIVQRTGDVRAADNLTDQDLLREVMNTVGREGRLGGNVRCVVSVSMLTEGWDASTVTHVLGVRAFGTQLLCEQVIGRALRRQSYELNAEGLFDVEYADVLGIPFDFTTQPVIAPPQRPRQTVHVQAIRPDRDSCEIRFPRVEGYRLDLPETRLEARFTDASRLVLSPDMVGATRTLIAGIVGEQVNLDLEHTESVRQSQVIYALTSHLLFSNRWRNEDGEPRLNLFGQIKRIVKQWLDGGYLDCVGGATQAQVAYKSIADRAVEIISDAIALAAAPDRRVVAVLDAYNPTGSTTHVSFTTSKTTRWQTDSRRCHVNWAVLDSGWEGELCRVLEAHPRVRAYVKNHSLGFEVPYRLGGDNRRYRPDFIARVEDGHGDADLMNLVLEVKGYRGEDADAKKRTMESQWIPGVNNLGTYGRWAFAELTNPYTMEAEFERKLESLVGDVIDAAVSSSSKVS